MYRQSDVAFMAFLISLIFITLPPSFAHPISTREYGTAELQAPTLSDFQGSAPTITPTLTPTTTTTTTTTTIILPRDHESVPSDVTSTEETENPSETSSSSSSEETESEDDDEHSGLHPNTIAGIAVGVAFGVLLLIAAFMWAFRVGWEKGQLQKEMEKEKEMAEAKLQKPPAPPVAAAVPHRSWQLVDECITSRPPSVLVVDTTGGSCWDSGSWDCCYAHAENNRILGERYSFRPGMGVYEITDSEASVHHENVRTDSGLGMESPATSKKGKEPESPSTNV